MKHSRAWMYEDGMELGLDVVNWMCDIAGK
jgi:hypothetical protein